MNSEDRLLNHNIACYAISEKRFTEMQTNMERFPDYLNNWNDLIPLMIQYDVAYLIDKETTARNMAERLLTYFKSEGM